VSDTIPAALPAEFDPRGTRFVLVEPQSSGNVGSAARALKNLGFSRLILVRPACDPQATEATRMAVDARDLLRRALVVDDLDAALRGVRTTVGLSRRKGRRRRPHHRLDEFSAAMADLARAGEIAFVFGREDHGLSDLALDRCTHLAHFPSSDAYPSFNLAQSVLLVAYELRRATIEPGSAELIDPPAAHGEREAFFEHLEQAFRMIGYVQADTAVSILRHWRRLLGRAAITSEEVQLLRGLARQIQWAAGQAGLAADGSNADPPGDSDR